MFTKKEKVLLFILSAIQFVHIVDFMILMPLGPQLMRIFNITPQQFGLLVSSYTFSAGISGFAASFYIDRLDRKKALLLFFLGFSVGTLACALAPNYEVLLMTRSLTGIFGGVLSSLVMSIVSDSISYERRGTAMGIVMAAFSAASVLGVPFSLWLADKYNWHAPFVFLGSAALALNLFSLWGIPKMNAHLEHGHHRDPFATLKGVFADSNQSLSLLFMSLLIFGHFSIIPFYSPSMVANAGLLESQLPLIYLVGGAFSIVTSPLIGRLSDRYGKHRVFSIAAFISVLPIFLITHLGKSPLALILALTAFFFMIIGGRMIPANTMVSSVVPPQSRGSFMSLVSAVTQLSSAGASYVAGVIVSKGPQGELLHYEKVGYLAIAFTLLALFMSKHLKTLESKH